MNKSFNYEVNKVLKEAEREMLELKHPYVGTEHLLLSLLKKPEIAQIAKKNNLTYELFRRELINVVGCSSKKSEVILYTPLLRLVIDTALNLAKEDNQELSAIHLMSSLISSDDGIALRILMGMNIDLEKLYFNMLEAKAEYLYNLPQWDAIFSAEKRKEIQKAYRESTMVRNENKVGRNDACPCGSGKKYKKCCGK